MMLNNYMCRFLGVDIPSATPVTDVPVQISVSFIVLIAVVTAVVIAAVVILVLIAKKNKQRNTPPIT